MPLYEFRCNQCGLVSEALVRMSAAPQEARTDCAHCGCPDTVRIISRVSIKVSSPAMYSEQFLEASLPFLKSRPETAGLFQGSKASDEATANQIADRIGKRIDQTLNEKVFRNLPS